MMSTTGMDHRTDEDWAATEHAVNQWQSFMPKRIQSMLLESANQCFGSQINQLQHGLQTATRALRDGASTELVIAALCHDIGDVLSVHNHAAIAAEILRPYVSRDVYEIVRTHQDFQRRHYGGLIGRSTLARWRYVNRRWYKTACTFSDEWDQASFDPHYDTLPLEYFEPMIDRVFGQPARTGWGQHQFTLLAHWTRIKSWFQ